jgi:uncharacterized small protein (DUF1192 family)
VLLAYRADPCFRTMAFVDQQAGAGAPPPPAPATAASTVDDDPAAFLQSIRELTQKREREDAERIRKLEEEVKRTREERAARRAGRSSSAADSLHGKQRLT